jgi:hypothetical protein
MNKFIQNEHPAFKIANNARGMPRKFLVKMESFQANV